MLGGAKSLAQKDSFFLSPPFTLSLFILHSSFLFSAKYEVVSSFAVALRFWKVVEETLRDWDREGSVGWMRVEEKKGGGGSVIQPAKGEK